MSFGLSELGFLPKRLLDIQAELELDFKTRFGNIDVDAASVTGQIIGVLSKPLADIWEQLESVYLSEYRASAEGFSLDNVVQYIGITRLPSTRTTVQVGLKGIEGSIIPAGTQVNVEDTGEIFEQDSDITITEDALLKCEISVDDVTAGAKVITINYIAKSYTVVGTMTAAQIAYQLVELINADSSLNVNVLAVDDEDGTFTIITKFLDSFLSFSSLLDSNLSYSELWTMADYIAVNYGSVLALTGNVNTIVTPKAGLDEVYNFSDGVVGRDSESDSALRIRAAQSTQLLGAATVEAIRARLQQGIEEALQILVFENTSDIVVSSRPPHSFEAVVDIDDDEDLKQEVAEIIWDVKPAGIATYGTINKTIVDSQGYNHIIYFSRPTRKPIFVIVNYTKYDEEIFPSDGDETIANQILSQGNLLGIGVDVIPQRFFGGIFTNVPGIEILEVLVGFTNPPTLANPLSIGETEIAQFLIANITVNDVTF